MARPHFGLILPNYGSDLSLERLVDAARAAEAAGFDSGWVTDHVLVPDEYADIYGEISEALVSLAYLSAQTSRLELGVSALVVPQRNPLVTLKQLTSLDFLSRGRIVTAVAAGWMEGEFETLGASFGQRGKLLDEWLVAARSAFEQMPGHVKFDGALLSFEGRLAPALVRPGGPELWVAGVSRATVRRAAITGVWHPVALPPETLRAMAAELRSRRPDSEVVLRISVFVEKERRAGRDERGRHAIAGPPEWVAERLVEYLGAGCTGFVLNLDYRRPGLDERVWRFVEEVVPLVRSDQPAGARASATDFML
jgi:alkanesulfonate monooxygenase SsuD/methylene tetrahydromethanopterin reductase-like flavin-dependent oxidoreductase (luciferase family)